MIRRLPVEEKDARLNRVGTAILATLAVAVVNFVEMIDNFSFGVVGK